MNILEICLQIPREKWKLTTYSVDFDSYTIDYVTGIIYD